MMLSLKDEEQNDVIVKDNQKSQNQEGVDISVDFEIYQKIKQFEEGKGKGSKSMQPVGRAGSKKSKPKNQGEIYRDRVKEYLEKKRKFTQIGYSKDAAKNLTFSETRDMAKRPEVQMSSFGADLVQKQKIFQNDIKRIQKSMVQTKSFLHGAQEKRRREAEDIVIQQQIKEIRAN